MFSQKNKVVKNKVLDLKITHPENVPNKIDYAIVSAMPEELEFFINEFAKLEFADVKIGEFEFKIYDYLDNKILIAHTGIGTAFAASVLTLIESYFHPEYFLVSGTAGAIKEGLQLRDVIVVEKAFEAEIQDAFTLLKDTPFEACLKHPIKDEFFPSHYAADPTLLKIFDSLDLKDLNVYKGTLVSSNAFPAPKELFDKIKHFNPYAIDMETSAFYQTAWLLNTKVIAVRGVSNILNPDGTDENVHASDVHGSSLAAASVLLAILNQSILLKSPRQQPSSSLMQEEALHLIKKFNLQPHPEGGYFSVNYKSTDEVKPCDTKRYDDKTRSAGSSIYYLLNNNDYSAWHCLKSDELWHFYKGSPINIHILDGEGNLTTHMLGDALQNKNALFQISVKAGVLIAAENLDKNAYSLVGCTVSPGFEYSDFMLAQKEVLIEKFPQHQSIIERLSRDNSSRPAIQLNTEKLSDTPCHSPLKLSL
ncbi:MAG: cupin domain-containing protein [Gammaproteobacteria bacterium]|nr:cupin domain-containing protein [Gammaproteobacteria bacterium]